MILIWNTAYDIPRIEKNLDLAIPREHQEDTMALFHCLWNAWKRKLGFATSLLPSSWNLPMWKHTSGTDAARYSALDAIALLRNHYDLHAQREAEGCEAWDLIHTKIDPALDHMSKRGLLVDRQMHAELQADLSAELEQLVGTMTALVPEDIRSPHVWSSRKNAEKGKLTLIAKAQRDGESFDRLENAELFLVPATKTVVVCSCCGTQGVTAPHRTRKFLKEPARESVA